MAVRMIFEPPHPTWFRLDEAGSALAKGREPSYAAELRTVIDRAVERLCAEDRIAADSSKVFTPHRIWRSLLRSLRLDFLK